MEAQPSGIRLTAVFVERIRFDDVPQLVPKVAQHKLELAIQRTPLEEGRAADVAISVRLSPAEDEKGQPFLLEVTIVGRFEQDLANPSISVAEFTRVNAPAHLMPFVREIVANVTARSRLGVILMPAMNVVALVQQQDAAAAASPQVPAQ